MYNIKIMYNVVGFVFRPNHRVLAPIYLSIFGPNRKPRSTDFFQYKFSYTDEFVLVEYSLHDSWPSWKTPYSKTWVYCCTGQFVHL